VSESTLSVGELEEQCKRFEQVLTARKLATSAEIDPHRPGGPENPDSGPRGWLHFYGELRAIHTRGDAMVAAARTIEDMAAADGRGLELFANKPETVRCVGLGGEAGKVYQVHPKCLGALILCHERDERLQWLALRLDELQRRGTAADLDLVERVDEEMLKNLCLIAWVVTTPGKGLPWDRLAQVPEPPEEFRQLDLPDLLAIHHAHMVVNGLRIEMVRRSVLGRRTLESGPADSMPRWTTFVGQAAMRLNTRADAVMWDWTLAELLLAVATSAEVERRAYEHAQASAGAAK